MNIQNWNEERIDNVIRDLEEWMTLVASEEDWLITEDDDVIEIFGSKANYLNELISWVCEHVCSEDRDSVDFWVSHNFTEEEAQEMIEEAAQEMCQ